MPDLHWAIARRRHIAKQAVADAAFNESDHPRSEDGKFGSGGGSSSKGKSARLSSSEEYAINHYVEPSTSDTGFLKLNTALRSGDTLNGDQKKQVERLDSAIKKIPKFEGRTYRAVNLDGAQLDAFLSAGAKDAMPGRESDGTPDDVAKLMEYRSFGTGKNGYNFASYYRHDGDIQIVVRFKDGRVENATAVFSGNYRRRSNDAETREGWDGLFGFAQAYGD